MKNITSKKIIIISNNSYFFHILILCFFITFSYETAAENTFSKIISEVKNLKNVPKELSQKMSNSLSEIIRLEQTNKIELALKKILDVLSNKQFAQIINLDSVRDYMLNKTIKLYTDLHQTFASNKINLKLDSQTLYKIQNVIKSNINLFFQKLQEFLAKDLLSHAEALISLCSKVPEIAKDERYIIAKALIAEAQNNEQDLRSTLSNLPNISTTLSNKKLGLFWQSSLAFLQLLVDPRLVPPSNITQMISEQALKSLSQKIIKKRLAAVNMYSKEQLEAEGLYNYIKALFLNGQYDEALKSFEFFKDKYGNTLWFIKLEDFLNENYQTLVKQKIATNSEVINNNPSIHSENTNPLPSTPSVTLGESF